MNASDIVIRIERSLLSSRMASDSMVWAGSMRSSSSHRRASPNALMKPSRAFVRMARRGRCASPTPWMISRRRREDTRVQGSVKTRSCPSQTMDSFRTISIRVALTVTQPIAFRTSFSLGRSLRMGLIHAALSRHVRRRGRCDSRRSRWPAPRDRPRLRWQPGSRALEPECGRPIRPLSNVPTGQHATHSSARVSTLRRMAGAHPVSAIVIELAHKKGMIVRLARAPRLRLAGEPLLDPLPDLNVDDRWMKAVVDLPFVAQPSDIDRVR